MEKELKLSLIVLLLFGLFNSCMVACVVVEIVAVVTVVCQHFADTM